MSEIDAALLQGWIGRRETRTDLCDARRVADLAATLDRDTPPLPGATLPPGWHWMFFNAMAPARELGPDGHPRRGGFLPPVPLPRRMWAGGRLDFHAPIQVGATLRRESEIAAVDVKQGRSGAMVFVRVRHAVHVDGALALTETHDIVYRAAPAPGAPTPPVEPAPTGAVWRQDVVADAMLLFRYSNLFRLLLRSHRAAAHLRDRSPLHLDRLPRIQLWRMTSSLHSQTTPLQRPRLPNMTIRLQALAECLRHSCGIHQHHHRRLRPN